MNERKQAPDWFFERFYQTSVKPGLEWAKECKMEWAIKKSTMVATLNYLRVKYKLKCEWIEKREDLYMIKITIPNEYNSEQKQGA